MIRFPILFLFVVSFFSISAGTEVKKGETLQIIIQKVSQNEQMRINSTYVVNDEGFIKMWKIGKVKAAGLAPKVIAGEIAKRYRAMGIYRDPTFQVTPDQNERCLPLLVYTRGAVVKAGSVPFFEDMTILDVLEKTGGVTNPRGLKQLKIHRGDKILTHNLFKENDAKIKIYPRDTIEIPTAQNMVK